MTKIKNAITSERRIYHHILLTITDVKRSAEFYLQILGGEVVRSSEPTIFRIANTWSILDVG